MEVVDLSRAEYRNRDALNQALDLYLGAMFLFVSECLDEQLIREFLRLLSDDDLRNEMEVKDIADLIKRYWSRSFKEKFKIIDRYGRSRYYDARSVTSLIVEGRNRVSHQRLQELDPEFTRAQLFLIAEVLGQINMSAPQHEVEAIRDKLFKDTVEQPVTGAVETEKAKYEKSIAEVERRLAAAEGSNKELSKRIVDNAVKLDEKKEELEKLSERFVVAKLDEKEYEKRLNSTSKQLEKVQVEHSACEERFTTISNRLASTEAKRDDYKERLETVSTELESVKVERITFEERLTATSNKLASVQVEKNTSEKYLAVTQKLLTTVTIIDQSVFPPLKTDSVVRILDRRGMNKRDYLLELLEQKQPTIIYVQSEKMVNNLFTLVGSEKAEVIGRHNERTSKAEEMEILEKLENRELIAVVSNTTLSTLASAHCVEHFVFCHLTPGLDEFFEQCQPAFTSQKDTYLHLIYNGEQDIEKLDKWLAQKYPDRETLINLHGALKGFVGVDGDFVNPENLCDQLDIVRLGITELGIETGLAIFEEVGALERNKEGVKPLPFSGRRSEIYHRGEALKDGIAEVRSFQLERPIEKIWEEILEKLNVDIKQILRESNIHKIHFKSPKMEIDTQPTTSVGQDKIAPPIPDPWPQRGMSAFSVLRQRASNNFAAVNTTLNTVNELADEMDWESPELEVDEWQSPVFEDREDYENKYDLAMQFAQEHGIEALEQGIAELIEDRDNSDYDFKEDETNMLRAFQNALKDFQTQSEQTSEGIEGANTAIDETVEASHPPKPPRANAKVTVEQVREIRSRSAAGESYSGLAKEFGLTPTGIRNIVLRNTWKHVE